MTELRYFCVSPEQVIPFWILDFRFWIVKQLVVIAFGYTSVAIIFQIGIIQIFCKNNFDYLSNSNIGVSRQNTGKVFCTTCG